jgi:hypothetical protein
VTEDWSRKSKALKYQKEQIIRWSTPCAYNKWNREGGANIVCSTVDGKFVDLRIKREPTENFAGCWSKHGIRMPIENLETLIPILQEILNEHEGDDDMSYRTSLGDEK